jgi:trans-aconitate methyltransferase
MKLDQHYVDPRLVELYDIENPRGVDTDFYIQIAAELNTKVIVDLGCGTGLLTRELAVEDRQVIGVDPATAMLDYARRQPGANKVQWIEGDSSVLERRNADLVIMTGNVAQDFLDDTEWDTTLRRINLALKSGGHLAFESRNPNIKAWEGWNRESTFQTINSRNGSIESWLEILDVSEGKVTMCGYNHFLESGEEVVVDSTLRFRSQRELIQSLNDSAFIVENVYGSWDRMPIEKHSKVMIFIASRQ